MLPALSGQGATVGLYLNPGLRFQGESASLHPLEPLQFSKEVLTVTKQLGHE